MEQAVNRWHLFRLRRAYRTIAKVELHCGDEEVAIMRTDFTKESFGRINAFYKRHGYTRQQRRQVRRDLVKSDG